MSFQTPILLIAFNRPFHTGIVLDRLAQLQPKQLYVVGDGPRTSHAEDKAKVEAVRETIFKKVTWECELKTLFREDNLGCGRGPAAAINWFFENVEQGIILEDDCLPSISFFNFCEILLTDFRDDKEIFAISGFNACGEWCSEILDYFFSDGGNWGWATWRRAWTLFDYSMNSWLTINDRDKQKVLAYYPNFPQIFKKIVDEDYDAWDIQWHYTRIFFNGLTITPSKNLVQNIGFDKFATHTTSNNVGFASVLATEIAIKQPLRGPEQRAIDMEFRKEFLRVSNAIILPKYGLANLKQRVRGLLKKYAS
jgi:hypothetical protein